VFQSIRECVLGTLKQYSVDIRTDLITVEPPKDQSFGDIYTNAAMLFAKKAGVSPRELAEAICKNLLECQFVSDAVIAGPGFINIRLRDSAWQNVVNNVLMKKEKYSDADIGAGALMNVEFVSANPTGPLHTGHARNAVFGSVVANLFEKIGYKVAREFYVNDQGNQIKALARSVYLRYQELLGRKIQDDAFGADMYCGGYVKDIAQKLIDAYEAELLDKDESEWMDLLRKFSIDQMLDNIKDDLESIGISMEQYTSEEALCKKKLVDEALDILIRHGDIYEGVLPRPKGIGDDDEWEERPQTLFRATKYGDDVDRAIKKSDGTWTYFAGDLAYHLDKIRRGYSRMVAVLGADHNGYLKRLKAAVRALSNDSADIEIRLYQLVNFLENSIPIKMSKRSGNFITLKDVVERVGKDVTRYMMISRHHDVMIDFDFAKAIAHSMDNPLFYIQYAYARICSVFKHYESIFGEINNQALIDCDKSCLFDVAEISLMKALAFWPEQVKTTAIAIEPHRIPNYLQNIAYLFHALWNKGKANTVLRFIDKDDKNCTISKLSLLQATRFVIEDGLKIMGIVPMSEMI
jgi:arginyl-tRNA synthetase